FQAKPFFFRGKQDIPLCRRDDSGSNPLGDAINDIRDLDDILSPFSLRTGVAASIIGGGIEARRVRLDSIGWARYGFGPDWAVRAKLREIASLNPRNG
ncbi:hypothetical protein LCGC14_2935740, partial [marine sediment metagenome]